MIPAWVDREQYPFQPRSLTVGAGTMRYVDEGAGPPIVMVHGTPTWSFLHRDLIKGLRDRHRCVAPDHLGFGLSDKPAGASYPAIGRRGMPPGSMRASGWARARGTARCAAGSRLFAHAAVPELPNVGHAPMEERAPEIPPVRSRFLEERTAS